MEEPEDEDADAESWRPRFSLGHDRLTAILARHSEIAAASRQGSKKAAVMQMKRFDDCFHSMLATPVAACSSRATPPTGQAEGSKAQLSYADPLSINGAFLHQEAIRTEMRKAERGSETEISPETDIGKAVFHNLQRKNRSAEWIDLDTALKGPVHVARLLIKKLQDDRSTPAKPYRLNAEQLECVALFVDVLEKAFEARPAASEPWLHPAQRLVTIVTDGGGGGGSTATTA